MLELIDRHALLTKIYDNPPEKARMEHAEWYRKCIYEAPTIGAEPVRHGRWEYRHADDWMFCTACGADAEGNYDEPLETDYCPHCGARMDGGADD